MLTLLLLTLSTPPVAAETVDAAVDASAAPLLDIEFVCGTVRIVGWGKRQVHATGDAPPGSFSLDGRDDRIGVEASDHRTNKCVDLTLHVPAGASLRTETRAGDVIIDNITGRVDAESISGSVQVRGAPKSLRVELISGAVSVKGPAKSVDVETVSGNVDLDGVVGQVIVETVSGNLVLKGGPLDRVDSEAISGSVDLAVTWTPQARVVVASHSGEVHVQLSKDARGRVALGTHSGAIRGELGAPVVRPEYGPGASCHYALGAAGGTLDVTTFSGNIRVTGP